MVLIGKIRGMRMRDGKSISEISRLTSLSRNTIKKWLSTPQSAAPNFPRPSPRSSSLLTDPAADVRSRVVTGRHFLRRLE